MLTWEGSWPNSLVRRPPWLQACSVKNKQNVWFAKKDTKRSSVLPQCLVTFFANQTLLKPIPFKFLPWHRRTHKRTTVRPNFDHPYFFQPIPGQQTSWNFDPVMTLIKISSCCRTLVRRCCYGRNLEVLSTFQYLTEFFYYFLFRLQWISPITSSTF